MQIEILKSVLYERTRYATGEIVDADDAMADALFGAGLARACGVVETAKPTPPSVKQTKAATTRKPKRSGIDAAFADMSEVSDGD